MFGLDSNKITTQKISIDFNDILVEIQGEIQKSTRKKLSFAKITELMPKTPSFRNVEKEIMDLIKEQEDTRLIFKM